MKPRQPVKKQNRARLKKRRAEEYGPKADWIREQPCVVHTFGVGGVCNGTPNHAHHYPTKGAGGKSRDLSPMCPYHHQLFHDLGPQTFESKYGVNLIAVAAFYEARWQLQGEA